MKKRVISLFLVIALFAGFCMPVLATSPDNNEPLPPWVGEEEEWFPANGIMPLEDTDGCARNHRPPSGFVYQGYTKGNSVVDAFVQGGLSYLAGFIPGLGTIITIIDASLTIESLKRAIDEGYIRTTYYKYVYTSADSYYYHLVWVYRAPEDGMYRQLGCEVRRPLA